MVRTVMFANKGDFGPSGIGGIQRYVNQLYLHAHGIDMGMSLGIRTYEDRDSVFNFEDLKRGDRNADIIHNLVEHRFIIDKKREYNFVSTAHEFAPLLYKQFDYDLYRTFEDYVGGLTPRILRSICKNILSSDFIIANSTQTMEEAIRLGFEKRRIFIATLGIDDRLLKRKIIKRSAKKIRIGYIGTMRRRKGVETVARIAKYLDRDKFIWDLYGRKDIFRYEKLSWLIDKYRNINYKGVAPEKGLERIYDGFDIFVSPTMYEGFGITIIEAYSRGIPVLIYRKSRIPDEVRKYCFEAEDANGMARIIKGIAKEGYDEDRRRKAIEYAKGFTWASCARKTLEAYEKILQRG